MLTSIRCYVFGCGELSLLSARHKYFGLVAACPAHNPIKHAYDRPLIEAGAEGVVILPEYREINARLAGTWNPDGNNGGLEVERPNPKPNIPPSDGAALEVVF